jgi:hypothetical protein
MPRLEKYGGHVDDHQLEYVHDAATLAQGAAATFQRKGGLDTAGLADLPLVGTMRHALVRILIRGW